MSTSRSFTADALNVEVHDSEQAMGVAAAAQASEVIREAVRQRGEARVVIATGNSQYAMVAALLQHELPWDAITVFHMDEYVGIDADHPASFQRWIRERIEEPAHPRRVEYISGQGDPEAEARRYDGLLRAAPLDLVCMGIGENGHLAFNEPFDTDFTDERWARVITLTPESRRQQVGEGHFPTIDDVPPQAITLTVPALTSARAIVVCAPEERKADAVKKSLELEVSPTVPSTFLRTIPQATLYLDAASSSLIGAVR